MYNGNMIQQTIDRCLKFFEITVNQREIAFIDWPQLPSRGRGVYVISDGDQVLYVGKGHVRSRQTQHYKKITNTLQSYFTEPKAWRWLRTVRGADHTTWRVTILYTNNKAEESALEGSLIYFLKPLLNDECFVQPD
jgi:excinuclease UvrABC nuclease subunit